MVEDSLYMQTLISEMLKVFGVGDIIMCSDAEEAIDLLTIAHARASSRHVNKVDIVVTDWLMPAGSGGKLLNWIRNNKNQTIKFMPVIVMSGYTTELLTHITRDMGANEILVKPISGKLLASRICSVIDNPRPFIQTEDFFGPDRRRQSLPYEGKDKRVDAPKIVEKDI
ncbi:MAG: response regulator [Alphaproteobacteria bacterium]|nr:response regulator [Alphaproteobacteria bacterium]